MGRGVFALYKYLSVLYSMYRTDILDLYELRAFSLSPNVIYYPAFSSHFPLPSKHIQWNGLAVMGFFLRSRQPVVIHTLVISFYSLSLINRYTNFHLSIL